MAISLVAGGLQQALATTAELTGSKRELARAIRSGREQDPAFLASLTDQARRDFSRRDFQSGLNRLIQVRTLGGGGCDLGWAGFRILESMSSGRFGQKRLAYLAASMYFDSDSAVELLILATNLLRKDLCSTCPIETCSVLCSLASFMSVDLAKDLCNDLLSLTAKAPDSGVRQRSVLLLPRLVSRFADSASMALACLRDRLADPDSAVRSAAVCAACELAGANPGACLPLAPGLFRLLCCGQCYFGLVAAWPAAKLLRLFGLLTPLEPRLGRKLIDPIVGLLQDVSSIPLLHECVNTLVTALQTAGDRVPASSRTTAVQLCSSRLHSLLGHEDRNIRYLGLLSMARLTALDPRSAQSQRELVASTCLTDTDLSVSWRAADLLCLLACPDSLRDIVRLLRRHLADNLLGRRCRARLLDRILVTCSANNYRLIKPAKFDWYLSELFHLAAVLANDESNTGNEALSSQLVDIVLLAPNSRVEARRLCLDLLVTVADGSCRSAPICLLPAAAWIYAEFATEAPDDENDDARDEAAIEAMLRLPRCPLVAKRLTDSQQAILVHNGIKLTVVRALRHGQQQAALLAQCVERLESLVRCPLLEVQERAVCGHSLMRLASAAASNCGIDWLAAMFLTVDDVHGPDSAVGLEAQRRVELPEGLDLDAWINSPLKSKSKVKEKSKLKTKAKLENTSTGNSAELKLSQSEVSKLGQLDRASNPHYLKSAPTAAPASPLGADAASAVLENASPSLDLQQIQGLARSDHYLMQQRRLLAEKPTNKLSDASNSKASTRRRHQRDEQLNQDKVEDEDSDELFSANMVSRVLDSPAVEPASSTRKKKSRKVGRKSPTPSPEHEQEKQRKPKLNAKPKNASVSSSQGDYECLPSRPNRSKDVTPLWLTVATVDSGASDSSDLKTASAYLELAWPTNAGQKLLRLRLRASGNRAVASAHILHTALMDSSEPIHIPGCPLAPGHCSEPICVPWSNKRRARLKLRCHLVGSSNSADSLEIRLPSLRLTSQLRPDQTATTEQLQRLIAQGELDGQAQQLLPGCTSLVVSHRLGVIARPLLTSPTTKAYSSLLFAAVDSRNRPVSMLAKTLVEESGASIRLEIRAIDQSTADALIDEFAWIFKRNIF